MANSWWLSLILPFCFRKYFIQHSLLADTLDRTYMHWMTIEQSLIITLTQVAMTMAFSFVTSLIILANTLISMIQLVQSLWCKLRHLMASTHSLQQREHSEVLIKLYTEPIIFLHLLSSMCLGHRMALSKELKIFKLLILVAAIIISICVEITQFQALHLCNFNSSFITLQWVLEYRVLFRTILQVLHSIITTAKISQYMVLNNCMDFLDTHYLHLNMMSLY